MSPIVKYVFRNLGARPFLSLLVLGAMAIVGLTLSSMCAITAGLVESSKAPGHDNWVIVTSREAINEAESTVEVADLPVITTSADVTHALPEVILRSHVVLNGALDLLTLRGVPPEAAEMHRLQIIEGRMPTPGEPEMIVGDVLLQHFPQLKIGSTKELMGIEFTVVGVFRAPGFFAGEAWTSRQVIQQHPRLLDLSCVYLETPSHEAAERVVASLSATRAVKVDAHIEREFYGKQIRQFDFLIRGLILIFLLVVTGAVLAGASLLSVFQLRRLSEQSVMRAMGYRAARIALLIVYETQILVMCGGLVGALVAWAVLRNYIVTALAPSLAEVMYRAPLTPRLAAVSLAGMFVIGLVGTVTPIVRMMRTPITRGLREE